VDNTPRGEPAKERTGPEFAGIGGTRASPGDTPTTIAEGARRFPLLTQSSVF
jgi:hypothetical protein